jgi:hypothetical protein
VSSFASKSLVLIWPCSDSKVVDLAYIARSFLDIGFCLKTFIVVNNTAQWSDLSLCNTHPKSLRFNFMLHCRSELGKTYMLSGIIRPMAVISYNSLAIVNCPKNLCLGIIPLNSRIFTGLTCVVYKLWFLLSSCLIFDCRVSRSYSRCIHHSTSQCRAMITQHFLARNCCFRLHWRAVTQSFVGWMSAVYGTTDCSWSCRIAHSLQSHAMPTCRTSSLFVKMFINRVCFK